MVKEETHTKAKTSNVKCESCSWWRSSVQRLVLHGANWNEFEEDDEEWGYCYVLPPQSSGEEVGFPQTHHTDFCSRFKRRIGKGGLADPHGYSEPFLRCWKAYPHFGQRSRKVSAWGVWRSRNLDSLESSILDWIKSAKSHPEWQKERGAFVPGFQVWLRGHDFADAAAAPEVAVTGDKHDAEWQSELKELRLRDAERRMKK